MSALGSEASPGQPQRESDTGGAGAARCRLGRRPTNSTSTGSYRVHPRSVRRWSCTPDRIATVLDPGCLAVAALLDSLSRRQPPSSFDPNVRPALIEDGALARERIERNHRTKRHREGQRRRPGLDRRRYRARKRLGPSMPRDGARHRCGDDGGARGVRGLRARHGTSGSAQSVEVVDTVGAGDSFMTGLIDALWLLNLLGAEQRTELAGIDLDALSGVLTRRRCPQRSQSAARALTYLTVQPGTERRPGPARRRLNPASLA